MADFRAVEAVGRALVHLFRTSYRADDFNRELEFEVYLREQFAQPMAAGVSVFLYRVNWNGVLRLPAGRRVGRGERQDTRLPVDLHFLLTVWAKDPSLQHRIAGWTVRTIEDTPVLPNGLLQTVAPGWFASDETIEMIGGELSNEELFRIWEMLAPDRGYQLSIPYLARDVRLESRHIVTEGPGVQQRQLEYGQLESPAAEVVS